MKNLFFITALTISTISYGQETYPSPICSETPDSIGFITDCEDYTNRDNNGYHYGYFYQAFINVTCVTYDGQVVEYQKKDLKQYFTSYFSKNNKSQQEAKERCLKDRKLKTELKDLLEKN